jgi:hypothetical protein
MPRSSSIDICGENLRLLKKLREEGGGRGERREERGERKGWKRQ